MASSSLPGPSTRRATLSFKLDPTRYSRVWQRACAIIGLVVVSSAPASIPMSTSPTLPHLLAGATFIAQRYRLLQVIDQTISHSGFSPVVFSHGATGNLVAAYGAECYK